MNKFIKKFSDISINDIESVGGKNASLGEMINTLSSLGLMFQMALQQLHMHFKNFLKQTDLIKKFLNYSKNWM